MITLGLFSILLFLVHEFACLSEYYPKGFIKKDMVYKKRIDRIFFNHIHFIDNSWLRKSESILFPYIYNVYGENFYVFRYSEIYSYCHELMHMNKIDIEKINNSN